MDATDISDTLGGGAFRNVTTSGAPTIGGVATNISATTLNGTADTDSVITYHVTGSGFDFFYDLRISAWQSEQGSESMVSKRLNGGEVMPDGNLAGEHRQRIDSPDTVGAGNWEFIRLSVENVVNNGGTAVTLLGFNAVRIDAVANAGADGNIEDVNNAGAVIDSWTGGIAGSATVDLSDTYTSSIDLVATSGGTSNNENQAHGFAVDFTDAVIPEPGSLALLGLGGMLIAGRRRRD